jgi:choline dehydrogenase-like flavoprotein
LTALGIDVVHHLPGVGENLQDHLEFYFQIACTQPITLYAWQSWTGNGRIVARWLLYRDGLGQPTTSRRAGSSAHGLASATLISNITFCRSP